MGQSNTPENLRIAAERTEKALYRAIIMRGMTVCGHCAALPGNGMPGYLTVSDGRMRARVRDTSKSIPTFLWDMGLYVR